MNQETVDALDKFFSAQKKLNELGIIRSRDYIGDVARYLCRFKTPRGNYIGGKDVFSEGHDRVLNLR